MAYGNVWQQPGYQGVNGMPQQYQVNQQPYSSQQQYVNQQQYGNQQQYLNNQQTYQDPPQIQNGGFIPVQNIDQARNYHIAPGTSITFIDENAPYVYTKTRGFSQLDQPVFEKLKLVKEEVLDEPPKEVEYILKEDFEKELEKLTDKYSSLSDEIKRIKDDMQKGKRK